MTRPVDPVLDAAQSHLPPGVAWMNVPAVFVVAATLGWLFVTASGLASATQPAPSPHAPWTERARAFYPVRFAMNVAMMVSCCAGAAAAQTFGGPYASVSGVPLSVIGLVVAALAGFMAVGRVERRYRKAVPLRRRLRDVAAFSLAFGPQLIVAVASGQAAIAFEGAARFAWLGASIVLVLLASRMPLLLLRMTGLLQPAPERLRVVVEELASATATPLPGGVHVLRWSTANALAYPTLGAILFTERAVDALSDDDVRGICAHELAHLREPRRVVAIRVATSLMLAVPPLAGPFLSGLAIPFAVLAALLAYARAQRWLQQYETVADVAALKHEPTPGAYGRALEKLHELNLLPAVLAKTTSHPHLYARLHALGVTPTYRRPEPPSQSHINRGVWVLVAVGAIAVVSLTVGVRRFAASAPARAVMVTGGTSTALGPYARSIADADPRAAAAVFRACLAQTPRDRTCIDGLATVTE